MKKILAIACISILWTFHAEAQAKQRKMLLEQIAALQVYTGYAKKGYTLARNGLSFIADAKKGELNLHSNYFGSLGKVNPKVRGYLKVIRIITLELEIIKVHKNILENIHKGDLFHGDELDYIQRTFDHLMDNCAQILGDLQIISTDSKLEMSDGRRIERIEGLYKMMMDNYLFCENFRQEITLMSLWRNKEKKDVNQSRLLRGL